MLINKGFAKNDVVSIKLASGEEVVARFDEKTDTTITIDKPMCIVPQQQGMGMAPFMFTTDETSFTLNLSSVVVITKTQSDLAKSYVEGTTSIQMV